MNIQEFYSTVKNLFFRYKILVIAVGSVLLFFLLVAIYFFASQPPPTSPPQSPPQTETGASSGDSGSDVHGHITLYEENENLEKKEILPDGTIKYTKTSDVSSRPDIVIVWGPDQSDVFNRSVSSPETPIKVSDYIDLFGQPPHIMNGSRFYGTTAQWYIYPDKGFAFVVKDGLVLEVHTFVAMSVDNYITKYGEDIISPTN